MTTRQRRGEHTAGRVLDAALALHGRGALTVPAVLDASGVSAGSLYHHFGSLDGLLAELYVRSMGELLDALVAATVPEADARCGVEAFVRAYLHFAATHQDAARVVHGVDWTALAPVHVAVVAAVKGPRIAALVGWARAHMAAGRMVELPDTLLEMLLVGPPAETVRRWLAGVPGVDLTEAAGLLPARVWGSVQL